MQILTKTTSYTLWQDAIWHAEKEAAIQLNSELETYLIAMLTRYMGQPDMAKRVLAHRILEALQTKQREQAVLMQSVGDECLLFAGLFPEIAKRKNVNIRYFVTLGQSAYARVSSSHHDLFDRLAKSFVNLMDVLQAMTCYTVLLPVDAYDQWQEVGSKRAFRLLQEYGVTPQRFK